MFNLMDTRRESVAEVERGVKPVDDHWHGAAPGSEPMFWVEVQGRIAKLKGRQDPNEVGRGGRRGKVAEWSRASRRRLMEWLGRVEWALGMWSFVTLTIHGTRDVGCVYDALVEWVRRVDGHGSKRLGWWKPGVIWRIELQKRGVVHLHLVMNMAYVPQRWLQWAWQDIIGQLGTVEISRVRSVKDVARYVCGYMTKEEPADAEGPDAEGGGCGAAGPSSLDQDVAYSCIEGVRRWWGGFNREAIPMAEMVALIVQGEDAWVVFWQVRRILRGLWDGFGRSGRYGGGWVFSEAPGDVVRMVFSQAEGKAVSVCAA